MVEREPTQLALELTSTTPTPPGTLLGPGDMHASFDGGLQLLAALEEAFTDLRVPPVDAVADEASSP
jgi:hypothetical protein